MTISSTTRKTALFIGDGSTTVYPFTFKVQAANDIAVYRLVSGVETLVGSGYTVTLNSNQNTSPGGTITWTTAPTSLQRFVITTTAPATQPLNIQNQSSFDPSQVMEALDRVSIQAQQLKERVDRALVMPITDQLAGDLLTATARASKALGFDSAGRPIALTYGSGLVASGDDWTLALTENYFDLFGSINLNHPKYNIDRTGATECTSGLAQAIADSIAANMPLIAGPGTYLTDCQLNAGGAKIFGPETAIFKLKAGATMTSNTLCVFKFAADNSQLKGCTIDFNKANQDKAAFNTAGGSGVRSYWPVYVIGTSDAVQVDNIDIDTKVINSADYAVSAIYVKNITVKLRTQTCGAGLLIKNFYNAKVNGALLEDCNNDDWKISPNAIDVKDGTKARVFDLSIKEQVGYQTSAGNSRSDWFQGVGIFNVLDFLGDNWQVDARYDTSATKSVGVSLLNIRGGSLTNCNVRRYTSTNVEIGGCRDFSVSGNLIDGEYLKPSNALWPTERSYGIHELNNGLNLQRTRPLTPNIGCHVSFNKVTGCLAAGVRTYQGSGTRFTDTCFEGNLYGAWRESRNVNDSFPTGQTQSTREDMFENCEFCVNEGAGFLDQGGIGLLLKGNRYNNNGQARSHPTPGTTRGGVITIAANESCGYLANDGFVVAARTRSLISGGRAEDNQTDTTSRGSCSPDAPTVVYVRNPGLYRKGMYIKLVGCGVAAADLIVCILSVTEDAITVSTALSTFPTSTKTGTLLTVSTAITGAGSLFNTEIQGPAVLKNGTNYRVISAMPSALVGTLATAFPADLPALSAVTIVDFVIQQIPSQNYAVRTTGATNDATITVDGLSTGNGNLVANFDMAVQSPVSTAEWALPIVLRPQDFVAVNGTPVLTLGGGSLHYLWAFDAASTERVEAVVRVPRNVTGKIKPVIYWANLGAGAGDVIWRVRYHFVTSGVTIASGSTIVAQTASTALAQDLMKFMTGTAFTLVADSVLYFAIDREGGNGADTLANDAGLAMVVLEAA